MVPHPAVMLALEFGAGGAMVADAAGRQRGSLVAGPGFGSGGAVLARGENVECVQVRLSPVIARAVLGISPADRAAQVAAESGYADQSHLHRDIIAFTGATPATVADEPSLAVDDVAWPTAAGAADR